MTFVKIYGLQRSGTNWLRFLIERNFEATSVIDLPLGSKHGVPSPIEGLQSFVAGEGIRFDGGAIPFGPEELGYDVSELADALHAREVRGLVAVKSLMPWLTSYHRFQRLREKDPGLQLSPEVAAQYCDLWISRNCEYLDLVPRFFPRWMLAHHGAFLERFDESMEQLAASLRLPRMSDGWESTDRAMRRGSDMITADQLATDRVFDPNTQAPVVAVEVMGEEVLRVVRERVSRADLPPALQPLARIG